MVCTSFFHCMSCHLVVGTVSEVVARAHVRYRLLRQLMHVLFHTDKVGTRSLGVVMIRLGGGGG